jgi:hypothetical protein
VCEDSIRFSEGAGDVFAWTGAGSADADVFPFPSTSFRRLRLASRHTVHFVLIYSGRLPSDTAHRAASRDTPTAEP